MKTAQVYGPDSRYLLVKASSGDLVQRIAREREGFYLIVLHGHFVCAGCTGPVAGAKPARGKIATEVWSPKTGRTDFGLGNRPVAMSHLRGPNVIMLAAAVPSVRAIASERKRAATRAAERLLRAFVPPPGSGRPARVPRGRSVHVLHQSGGERPAEVVDVHRFWSVRKSLKAVAAFVRAHRVRGEKTSGATYGTNVPHYLIWGFSWPPGIDRVPSRFLTVTAIGLPGRTVLRVDAQVIWIYPRSPSEKVPSGVHEIVVRAPKVFRKVTNPAKVTRIVRWFDGLPVSPPGVHIACLAVGHVDITLSFRSAHGSLLAQAKLNSAGGCAPIAFRIGGHPQRALIDRYFRPTTVERLQGLLGVRLVLNYE